ncbi:RNA polymerase sigma-70 factor, sigma-E family [Streptoalloteichus tenebrarius]|uniref:RNA polymerase sigma-70 factor, sigma-E family n=1 Tax=Streptoalloteichus tenebrarius (strain ATCC 17920 / DSM 40477 / JCM 4838 / CBS 697.72 / NBRC 16177 / NCIMB 11028 / NRRL B-12390 / A12253. 1 / ISP 5477) TaxID=1933 RepID=A0ABT1HXS3_STRSD|nr:SigE family RNA polymerase sigma factor [Streptoalloteichus tenebrarius]MCP2260319.1 RNA polymerase sigma-70 factor, sigma-E family [Streptoalloteichus tenebrarius]BFF03069.1 SigE family RNA polymerase sigma factor [Streptoalloteichus tenebrarius]
MNFGEFVADRRESLVRRAWAMTGNRADAEDLVQTALTNTFAAWERLREPAAADAYVQRAITNTFASWLRRKNRRYQEFPTADLPERPDEWDTPEEIAARDEHVRSMAALREALAALTPRQRSAVLLRYLHGRTEAETAETLGCSVGTVKSTVCRALARMRRQPAVLAVRAEGGVFAAEPAGTRPRVERALLAA